MTSAELEEPLEIYRPQIFLTGSPFLKIQWESNNVS